LLLGAVVATANGDKVSNFINVQATVDDTRFEIGGKNMNRSSLLG